MTNAGRPSGRPCWRPGLPLWDYNPIHIDSQVSREAGIRTQQLQHAVNVSRAAFNRTFGSLGFNIEQDNTSVTTSQGSGQPCGGKTGVPCGN